MTSILLELPFSFNTSRISNTSWEVREVPVANNSFILRTCCSCFKTIQNDHPYVNGTFYTKKKMDLFLANQYYPADMKTTDYTLKGRRQGGSQI